MSKARLRIWPELTRGRISPYLYGHSVEHVGRCVYDGLWAGPGSRTPHESGVRLDVMAALKQLRVPLMRWPGDAFASTYHWRDGVGPAKERPIRLNPCWQQTESNGFGTDEFLHFCHAAGCDPCIVLNLATAGPAEALAWAEYCTGFADTALTRLRAAHGHPEPYPVRLWHMGNTGSACLDARDFARACGALGAHLKAAQPDAQVIVQGQGEGASDRWTHDLCDALAGSDVPDHLGLCFRVSHGTDTGLADGGYEALFGELATLERALDRAEHVLAYFFPDRAVGIALTEWGIVHRPEASVANGMEQAGTLGGAVFAGALLNVLNRRAHRVTMANLAYCLNALHCLAIADDERLCLTPVYHVFDMMRRHMGASALWTELECATHEVGGNAVDDLNVSASMSGKTITATVANQTSDRDVELTIDVRWAMIASAAGRVLTGESPWAANSFEVPRHAAARRAPVAVTEGKVVHLVPAHSFTAFRLVLED